MHPVDEQLSALDGAVGILEVQRTRPDRLDLRAEQLHTGLIAVLHEVVVKGLAVLGRDFNSFFLRGRHLHFSMVSGDSIPCLGTFFKRKNGLCI